MKKKFLGLTLLLMCFLMPLVAQDIHLYPYSTQDTIQVGEQYCVEIRVDGFVDIFGYQFSINWNPEALQYDTIQAMNLPSLTLTNFNTTPEFTDSGNTITSWSNNPLTGITLPDGSSLFEICFTVLPTAAPVNIVEVSGTPLAIEFINSDEDYLTVGLGSTEIFVPVPGVQLIGGTAAADHNSPVCIPVRVVGFTDLTSLQFSLNWDTAQLAFTGVQNFNLPDLSINNFDIAPENDEGILRCSWTDTGGAGVTISDDTFIFDICFQTKGSLEVASVDFTDTPLMIIAMDTEDNFVNIETISGKITINGIPVWPGDTDTSEVVDNYDLLNIGLAYGEIGPQRQNASLTWVAQPAALWNYTTPNSGTNGIHIDTDGDGVVTNLDVMAVYQNWGETTNFWGGGDENRSAILPQSLPLADATLMLETKVVNPGENTTFNILFGDETTPAENIYGLAFTIVYDPTAVVGGSLSASFADSWLGDENNDLITIYRERAEDNRIDIALSRTNHENQSGFGAIAQLNLTIAELIQEENYAMAFDIENVRIINAGEEVIPSVQPTTYSEILGTTDTHGPELANQVSIFPVPARDFLQIRTSGSTVESTSLYSIDGKLIQHWNGNPQEISIIELAVGTYVLKLYTKVGMIHKRFVKQ